MIEQDAGLPRVLSRVRIPGRIFPAVCIGMPHKSGERIRPFGKQWVEILDFYHASQPLAAVAEAIWPRDAFTQIAWLDGARHRLRHEGGTILEEVWQALPPLSAAIKATVAKEQANSRLPGLPAYRAQELPIGSGISKVRVKRCRNSARVVAGCGGMKQTPRPLPPYGLLGAGQNSGSDLH